MNFVKKTQALLKFKDSVLADYGSVQRYRSKYHGQKMGVTRLPIDMIRKVGFQTMTVVRVMQLLRDLDIPVAPQIVSRLIRHLYASEIHWDAQIDPGISVVHGVGLVISHAARVGQGCILFHNVTLGEGIDPKTRQTGAPTLGRDVHVGPGTTLLGPIFIGDGTKIMAGSVVTESVPPNSLIKPSPSNVQQRKAAKRDDEA